MVRRDKDGKKYGYRPTAVFTRGGHIWSLTHKASKRYDNVQCGKWWDTSNRCWDAGELKEQSERFYRHLKLGIAGILNKWVRGDGNMRHVWWSKTERYNVESVYRYCTVR